MSDPKQNVMGNQPLEKAGVKIIVGRVVSFDTRARTVTLESGELLSYEKLVPAIGTDSFLPPTPGVDKDGVFTIRKSMLAMTALGEDTIKARKVVIIGGGFMGAEFTDELFPISGIEIHMIEPMEKLLYMALDDELCEKISQILTVAGIKFTPTLVSFLLAATNMSNP